MHMWARYLWKKDDISEKVSEKNVKLDLQPGHSEGYQVAILVKSVVF